MSNNNCGTSGAKVTIAASSSCTFEVVYSATTVGSVTGTVSISYYDGSTTQTSLSLSLAATAIAGAAASLQLTTAPSSSGIAGTSLSQQPSVTLKDSQGNTVSSTSTVTATAYINSSCTSATGLTGSLSSNTVAASSGVGTFSALKYSGGDTIYIQFTLEGQSVCSSAVTIAASPTVTAVSPKAVLSSGGTTITIIGTNFASGITATIGGTACTSPTYVNPTTMTCVTPSQSTHKLHQIVVINTNTLTGSHYGIRYLGAPALWLKADDMNGNGNANSGWSNNDLVGTWKDSSGNGMDFTQGTTNNKPVFKTSVANSLPVIRFADGSDSLSSSLSVTSQPYSFLIVYSNSNVDSKRAIQGSNNWLIGPYASAWSVFSGNWLNFQPSVTLSTLVGQTMVSNATTTKGYLNGKLYGQYGGTGTPGTVHLGAAGLYSGEPLVGDIAEILAYRADIEADGYRRNIECYLKDKYVLAGSACNIEVNVAAASMSYGENITFEAVGSSLPLSFSVSSGSGTIDSSTGSYTAPSSNSTETILITDALGATTTVDVTVKDFPASPALWLQADSIPNRSNGDPVSDWYDKRGSKVASVSLSNTANLPTFWTNVVNSKPVVRFDGNDYMSSNVAVTTQPYTAFVIYSRKNSSNRAIQGSNNWLMGPYGDSYQLYTGAFAANPLAVTQDLFILQEATVNATTATNYINGAVRGTSASVNAPGTIHLGAAGYTSESLSGDIGEVIFYNSVLSDPNRQLIECYLSNKYSLGISGY